MTFGRFSRVAVACLLLLLSGCQLHQLRDRPVEQQLVDRVARTVHRLEAETGLRARAPYRVRVVQAHFIDAQGFAAAVSPKGRESIGWVNVGNPYVVTFPSVTGKRIPDKVIEHEALHVILLSNGIAGHPESFSKYAWRW